MNNFQEKVTFLWDLADLSRGTTWNANLKEEVSLEGMNPFTYSNYTKIIKK